jgi:hypothetical protein
MKSVDSQLLENAYQSIFNKYALKEEINIQQATTAVTQALKLDVPEFVIKMRTLIKEPKVQQLLQSGAKDDVLPTAPAAIPLMSLLPTQNEIGFNESVSNLFSAKFPGVSEMIKGPVVTVKDYIVTYNGKYVIDGHHRWSQAFVANPENKINAVDIKGNRSPKDILKIVQLVIASSSNDIAMSTAKGTNVLTLNAEQIQELVNKQQFTRTALSEWNKAGFTDETQIRSYITKNLNSLTTHKPIKGAPARDYMPQTDAAGGPGGLKDKMNSGKVNWNLNNQS